MYSYIKGRLVEAREGAVVLENNGIGYEIGVSGNTLSDAAAVGADGEMKLYTYLYVREDTFALYGFSRYEEKTLFMRLIDISGVGPKLAMQVLGGYDLGTLTAAIATRAGGVRARQRRRSVRADGGQGYLGRGVRAGVPRGVQHRSRARRAGGVQERERGGEPGLGGSKDARIGRKNSRGGAPSGEIWMTTGS